MGNYSGYLVDEVCFEDLSLDVELKQPRPTPLTTLSFPLSSPPNVPPATPHAQERTCQSLILLRPSHSRHLQLLNAASRPRCFFFFCLFFW